MGETCDAVGNSKLYIDLYSCLILLLIVFAICKTCHSVFCLCLVLTTRVSRSSLVLTYFFVGYFYLCRPGTKLFAVTLGFDMVKFFLSLSLG
jgi:hypothetical protein